MPPPPPLHMFRPDIDSLPPGALPEGFTIRCYRPGDSEIWNRLQRQALASGDSDFDRDLRNSIAFRPYRVLLLLAEGGEPVGTASAWRQPLRFPNSGVLQYVAVLPEYRGRKLGREIALAAMQQMKAEGRTSALALVEDCCQAGIRLCLSLGFEPLLADESHGDRWREVFEQLSLPDLKEKFAPLLNVPPWQPPRAERDCYDYPSKVFTRRRWLPERTSAAIHEGDNIDAYGDESLYKCSELGRAWADPSAAPAGEAGCLELSFRAGRAGIHKGGRVLFLVPGQQTLGVTVQAEDPGKVGYLTLKAPEGVTVCAAGLGFEVAEGELAEGDEVRLTLGGKGDFPWTPLAGRKQLKVIISPGPREPQQRLSEPVVVEVLPGPVDHMDVFLPGTARPDEVLRATISCRDKFDNRVPYGGEVEVFPGPKKKLLWHMTDGLAVVELGKLGPLPKRISASIEPLRLRYNSNWCVPSDDLHLYFGDLHCHDLNSEADGFPSDVYRWAIQDKRLDFLSPSIQSHGYPNNEKWTVHKLMAEAFLDEGRFVTFPAFEWQHSRYGDKVVHYLGGDQPYLPVEDERYDHPAKLYEALRGSDALVVTHHPARTLEAQIPGTDWDTVETDVDRLVELWSMHGSSERFDLSDGPINGPTRAGGVKDALDAGLRMGFVAGSDTHSVRPGGSAKEPCGYWGGLCAVWAEKLTRRGLFEALKARRTYALTGSRIALRFTVNDAPMGSEIPRAADCRVVAEILAPSKVAKVQLMRNGAVLFEESPSKEVCRVQFDDRRRPAGPATYYHCRVTLDNGHLAVCSPVWVG